jgi:hypothetical protein
MRTETPSGLRSITHAHIEAIEAAQAVDQAQRITKWEAGELAKVACIAARVGDFPLNLLRDLIDRTQPSDWTDDDSVPMAWPSNFTLAMTHQCNVTTVQRAIHKLTKAGLVIPRDRGGRHRCGTRADDRGAQDVYGYDLSPLIVRAAELRALREATKAATCALRTMMRSTGSVREQVRALITSAEDQSLPGDWASIQQRLDDLARRYRSALTKPDRASIRMTLDERAAVQRELDTLYAEALALFKAAGSDGMAACRVDNGEDRAAPASYEDPETQPSGRNFEALTNTNNRTAVTQVDMRKAAPAASAPSGHSNERAGGADGAFGLTNTPGRNGHAEFASGQAAASLGKRNEPASESPTAKPVISLKALARACPAIRDWCDDDPFRSEGAFLHWSETIKSVVGISDDAWRTARTLHGSWDTAAIAAYVLQRQENGERSGTGKVTQPGGLFRALSDRYGTGSFNLLRSLGHLQVQALGSKRDGKGGNGVKRTGRQRSS